MKSRATHYNRLPAYYNAKLDQINFRQHPEKYRIGKGEQGVLMVEPYKSEILPHWRFKTPEIAEVSAQKIYNLFLEYLEQGDFVGADMARKFLQMGFTRARRYANHRSGRKYAQNPQLEPSKEAEQQARQKYLLPTEPDSIKAAAAEIFRQQYQLAKENTTYQQLLRQHRDTYEGK